MQDSLKERSAPTAGIPRRWTSAKARRTTSLKTLLVFFPEIL